MDLNGNNIYSTMETESFMKPPVVIDNGSGYMKIGFSGDQKKPFVYPSLIGRPKYDVVIPSTSNQLDAYMGEELRTEKRGLYKMRYPINHGIIESWDDMELLWKYGYSLLKISPKDCPVLLTEANMNPNTHRKKMLQIFFDKFQVPAVYIAVQGVLSLFATGKSTGIVLDSGDGVTHVIPVCEGYSLANACERIDFGGRNVTQHLQRLLRKSGLNLCTSAQFELVKQIKEKCCVIRQDKRKIQKGKYTLPDGQVIEFLNNETDAGQILFSPSQIGLEHPSMVQLMSNSLSKVDIDLRQSLYQQIILSGGNTMFKGFPERFMMELKKSCPNKNLRVLAPAKRDTVCWEGGSILASLPSFKSMWITRSEYKEKRNLQNPKKI